MNDVQRAPDNTYLIPSISNFPVVDALLKLRVGTNIHMFGFQMTVSESHHIETASLAELLKQLRCTEKCKFNLVWVTPHDIRFRCAPLPSDLEDRVAQWVLNLYLEVPSAIRKTSRSEVVAYPPNSM